MAADMSDQGRAWEKHDARAWVRSHLIRPRVARVVRVKGLVHDVRLTLEGWTPETDLGFSP